MIGALLVFSLAVLLGALLGNTRYRGPKDLYVHGRRVQIESLDKFRVWTAFPPTGTWSDADYTPVMDVYVNVLLEGVLLRGLNDFPALEVRFTPEAARHAWQEATNRLRREARLGRLGGRPAPRFEAANVQKVSAKLRMPKWVSDIDAYVVAK